MEGGVALAPEDFSDLSPTRGPCHITHCQAFASAGLSARNAIPSCPNLTSCDVLQPRSGDPSSWKPFLPGPAGPNPESLSWVLLPWFLMSPSLARPTLLEWPMAYADPVGLGTPRRETQQPVDAGMRHKCPCPSAFSACPSLVLTPSLPCTIWALCKASSWQVGRGRGMTVSWSSVLHHLPHAIIQQSYLSPLQYVRPSMAELSVCGRKEG